MATLIWAYPWGPPDAKTGAPGENTCAQCHGNLNIGSGSGNVFAPAEYLPGDTLDLSVAVQQTGQIRWGFEVTVLDSTNQPVGSVIMIDSLRTQLSTAGNGRQYLKHTLTGTDSGVPDAAPGWSFRWAAPAEGAGPVTFYCACNATNGNDEPSGDFIYTTSKTLTQSPCVAFPGDANASGDYSLGDVISIVNYVFNKPGCAPQPLCWLSNLLCRGDWNTSGNVSLSDIIQAINYLFNKPGGPWLPESVDVCCLPGS